MVSELIANLTPFIPSAVSLVGITAILFVINRILRRDLTGELSVSKQLTMLGLTAAGLLIFIFSLPLSETSRGQILSLLGIVVTAVIALSSTTFVANMMAGLMLRAVNSFRPGDFVRSETFFGRVTERGLFHTEIQTEDRDLTTLPNMYLVNNPVTVVHDSGTIISATLSLGYDVPHGQIDELLKVAAEETGLDDAFVLVIDLNDFSVTYRVGGFSTDTNRLLTIKSNLRKNILKILHESGIEIVSPNFMNQRVLSSDDRIIPARYQGAAPPVNEAAPEEMIFDKAGSAAEHEQLKLELVEVIEQLDVLSTEIKSMDPDGRILAEKEVEKLNSRIEEIKTLLAIEIRGAGE